MGTNPTQTTQLADSLCAKLCHEMSGPLGTVTGALDMAAEDPETAAESLQLAHEAASQMVLRLRLLRAAWAGECGPMDAADLAKLAAGLPPRVKVELGGLVGQFSTQAARVLINLLLLGMEALPRGGTISLSGAPGQDVLLAVSGAHAAWPSGLASALADPMAARLDDPRQVQAPLVAQLAQAAGLRLSLLFPATGQDAEMAPLLLTAA
jgi:histidine phosphotransferase ChpT